MTTDTFPKEAAVRVKDGNVEFTIGGAAKGSGMIHPDLATLLCFHHHRRRRRERFSPTGA